MQRPRFRAATATCVALTTILAGLSAGGTASAADGASPRLPYRGSFIGANIVGSDKVEFHVYRSKNGKLETRTFDKLADAILDSPDSAAVPAVGSTGEIKIEGNSCLAVPKATDGKQVGVLVDCDVPNVPQGYQFLFKHIGDGIFSTSTGYLYASNDDLLNLPAKSSMFGTTTDQWSVDTKRDIATDDASRTATLTGAWYAPDVRVKVNGAVPSRDGWRWSHTVTGLDVGENTITIEYELFWNGSWENLKTETRTVTIDGPSVPAPTASVAFDPDITKKAVVSGQGAPNATITVKNGSAELGSTTVDPNGSWSYTLDPLSAGTHTLTIEQTGIDGTQTTTTEADFGAAVAITGPSGTVAPGVVKVTGTTQAGATVQVKAGSETAQATVTGTTWSADVEIPAGTSAVTITASQQSKGALRTSAEVQVTPNGSQELQPVAITGPAGGHYSNDGKAVEVKGTATPYASVTVKSQWGTLKTVTADRNGNWSFWRGFGPDVTYQLTATQALVDGQTSTSAGFTLSPEGGDPDAPVVITEPSNGRYASSGATLVKGTAAANASIEIRSQWGVIKTVTADGMGNWSFWRGFGPDVTYQLVAKQTKTDGGTSESATFTLRPEGADPDAPVVITAPADGRYLDGAATHVVGTAAPDASVEISSQWGVIKTVKADGLGNWEFWRHFGPDVTYQLTAKQTKTDGSTSESAAFTLAPTPSQTSPVVITGPGDGYNAPPAATLMTGTASPNASVEIRSQWGVLKTVTADANGEWSFWRGYGPDATYEVTATQTRTDGSVTESPVFTLAPKQVTGA